MFKETGTEFWLYRTKKGTTDRRSFYDCKDPVEAYQKLRSAQRRRPGYVYEIDEITIIRKTFTQEEFEKTRLKGKT